MTVASNHFLILEDEKSPKFNVFDKSDMILEDEFKPRKTSKYLELHERSNFRDLSIKTVPSKDIGNINSIERRRSSQKMPSMKSIFNLIND